MKRKLKVLMLEDLKEDVELVNRVLKKEGLNFECLQVDAKESFIDSIKNYEPDVILSDHSLSQFNSLEALKVCHQLGVNVPFILVTGAVSEEFAVSCLKEGANDYILKSNLSRLPSAIQNAMSQHELKNLREQTEQEMRLQNEKLTKSNEEMDTFVYSVSHNLRAPLKSLLGLVNLVKNDYYRATGSHYQYFNMMSGSIIKLDETLKEILDYYRNARIKIAHERCDLNTIINDSFVRLKYLDGFDAVEKEVFIEENYPFYCDKYRVAMIFNNLLSNAIKFRNPNIEKSKVTIHAEITQEKVIVTIEDNGIGIAPEFIRKVFNMFFRATEKYNGAGLGLYIVKETVGKLQGKIRATSEYGVGTKIVIKLPNRISK